MKTLERRSLTLANEVKRDLFTRQETVGAHLETWERAHGRVIAPSEELLGDLHKLQERMVELHDEEMADFDTSVDITYRLGMLNSQVNNIARRD